VLFVLKAGLGGMDLPTGAFGVSYKTGTRRIDEWIARGIWRQIHELFLAKLHGADLWIGRECWPSAAQAVARTPGGPVPLLRDGRRPRPDRLLGLP
jgi:hypothetical protein